MTLASTAGARGPTPRIVNGLPTHAYPTVGALTGGGQADCTGTLIGCQTVLTAAHCVCFAGAGGPGVCPDGSDLESPGNIEFYLPNAGIFGVTAIDVHPSFEFAVAGDFALLHLATPIDGVNPSRINTNSTPALGTSGIIAGYGLTTGNTNDAGVKRFGAVTTASCTSAAVPDNTHVCWDFAAPLGPPGTNSNTCSGDSGGPLFVDFGTGDLVAGVTSGGDNGSCLAPDASFDADVYVERAWIQGAGGADLTNTSCGALPQIDEPSVSALSFNGSLSAANPDSLSSFDVPTGSSVLRVALSGEDGGPAQNDFDLFVRFGSSPSVSLFDCASVRIGVFEFCEIPAPAAGTWYLLAHHEAGAAGAYQAIVTVFPDAAPVPTATVPARLALVLALLLVFAARVTRRESLERGASRSPF